MDRFSPFSCKAKASRPGMSLLKVQTIMLALCLSAIGFGCAGTDPTATGVTGREIGQSPSPLEATRDSAVDPKPTGAAVSAPLIDSAVSSGSRENAAKLEALWNRRMIERSEDSPTDFYLGPGDLLRISVPLITQLQDQTVRVSADDTIDLPLLGTINVDGMTEDNLRRELIHRVAKYMYHPQVAVFLKHTEHQQVAVLGAVKRPGRYMLSSQGDTLMTMLSRAGGVNENAASRILLFPAPRKVKNAVSLADTSETRGVTSDGPASQALLSPPNTQRSPAAISSVGLGEETQAATAKRPFDEEVSLDVTRPPSSRYLEMAARAGDVIIVPAAGEVTVQGWVDKPGAYKVTPGLTTLGAIAAAGGPKYSSSATLLRDTDTGKRQIVMNLSKIRKGEASDIPVESGDLLIVEKSLLGAVPYSIDFVVHKVGLYPPLW